MVARSSRPDIRNPMLALDEMKRLMDADVAVREPLVAILLALARDCQQRADKAWDTHKAPMAVYWKGVAVYAGHTARALKRGRA